MTKLEFSSTVRSRLAGLPENDVQKAIDFYVEAINDRMDDGLTEEQAIAAIGTPEEVADRILMDTPLPTLVRAQAETKPKRRWRAWEIILIVLGSPVWLPICLALGAVALSLAIAIVAIVLSIVVAVIAVGVGGVATFFASFVYMFQGHVIDGLLQLGGSIVIVGISLILFIPIKAALIWLIEAIGRLGQKIKAGYIRKRNARANSNMYSEPVMPAPEYSGMDQTQSDISNDLIVNQ